MSAWEDLPRERLVADVSLWSANLANLEGAIERIDAFADSYHLDVSDAHFAPSLLFFPDLVRALRPLTRKPFHVHLMVERPAAQIADFVEAGADAITVHAEVDECSAAIDVIAQAGRTPGLALRLETPVAALGPFADRIGVLLLLGTAIGVKGQSLAPEACGRLTEAARLLGSRRPRVKLVADGGIRSGTVPLLRQAGADVIVPGSLVFEARDLAGTFAWLHAL